MRALVVEDDPGIASGLSASLRQAGYAVDVCKTLHSAWTALSVEPFDVMVLDLGYVAPQAALQVDQSCRAATCRC
jgi:two-component system, OmpR family, response regulator QseB